MAAIKLQKFLGAVPKISSELLPDGAAQIAYNLQLYSGDLIPYSEPAVTDSVPRLGTLQTLYGVRASTGASIDWLTWLDDVDIVTVSNSSDGEQRFYYTGDGAPKVSTYALATTGSEPYPTASGSYYDLGLPLPQRQLTTSATQVIQLLLLRLLRTDFVTVMLLLSGDLQDRLRRSLTLPILVLL